MRPLGRRDLVLVVLVGMQTFPTGKRGQKSSLNGLGSSEDNGGRPEVPSHRPVPLNSSDVSIPNGAATTCPRRRGHATSLRGAHPCNKRKHQGNDFNIQNSFFHSRLLVFHPKGRETAYYEAVTLATTLQG